MSALLDVVTEFRSATTTSDLVGGAPEVIAGLGFDRVLVSRVDDGVWVPEAMFVRTDARWAEAIVEAGRAEPTFLESVVESDVVASGASFVVDEVQDHPRVCRPIARVSRSDNYAVSPIVVGQSVVGMVHVDCYIQQRRVHLEECGPLALVAECLASHLSRLLLLEQLRAVQEAGGRSWSASVIHSGRTAPRGAHPSHTLTDREHDVMRLLATGETNYGIARRLGLSEGTVKSHVSKILHKLDATNRAQAVSRWGQA